MRRLGRDRFLASEAVDEAERNGSSRCGHPHAERVNTRTLEKSKGAAPHSACAKGQFSGMKKYTARCIFLLHAGMNLVFCGCGLTSPSARVSTA